MICETIPLHVNTPKPHAADSAFQPSLTTYLLDSFQTGPRRAVIICPGGGYVSRSAREGEPVAMRFLAAGIQAFVLNYSVAPARFPTAALELGAAVALVRARAARWNIDPLQVYILGFSAGGHLCATLGTLWDEPFFADTLGQSESGKPWKPDGMMLCYPVITMLEKTHYGSREMLLGEDATAADYKALSLELRITEKTIPAFLWHTAADGAVPVENTLMFAAGLQKARVPFALHVFEKGDHGLSLCDETTAENSKHIVPENSVWIQLAIQWMRGSRT